MGNKTVIMDARTLISAILRGGSLLEDRPREWDLYTVEDLLKSPVDEMCCSGYGGTDN